ncbi:LOB domain-containing protein 30-like [Magnolia sinica]|uniref:LOB domain-containing protein 30-like n=1 Tax=Magnolia sinica TaxID=86752 RepID=UPI00265B50B5|nr:LOB domain-containing protein 30-like [Magnolia sinica]
MSKSISSSSSGPCGACKFLRRKCATDCIFAPYFDSEQGAIHFAAVHKVFGASNVSKLLQRIPPHKRLDAVVTICYEAQARLRDPVYGCVSHIFALQQQVVNLQAELAYVQTHLSRLELPPQPRYLTTFPGPPSVGPTSDNSVIFNPQQPQQSSEMLIGQDSLDLQSGNVEFQALAQEVLSIYFPGVRFPPSKSC